METSRMWMNRFIGAPRPWLFDLVQAESAAMVVYARLYEYNVGGVRDAEACASRQWIMFTFGKLFL